MTGDIVAAAAAAAASTGAEARPPSRAMDSQLDVALDADGRVQGSFARDLAFHCRVWENFFDAESGDGQKTAKLAREESGSGDETAEESKPEEDATKPEKIEAAETKEKQQQKSENKDTVVAGTKRERSESSSNSYLEAVTAACLRLDALSKREEDVDATFWIPANSIARVDEQENWNLLEALASRIFRIHTAGADFDPEHSGVEWWVQIRDAPSDGTDGESSDTSDGTPKRRRRSSSGSEAAASAQAAPEENESDKKIKAAVTADATAEDEDEDAASEDSEVSSIPFHIDKDETLSALAAVYVTPALSTVTYLSDVGAPTVVTPIIYSNEKSEFEYTSEAIPGNMAVCYPKPGRHLVFDGRLMHGVPSSFARAGAAVGGRRITFLANIWLNHEPVGIEPIPAQVKRSIYNPESPLAAFKGLDLGPEVKPSSVEEAGPVATIAAAGDNNNPATEDSASPQIFPLSEAPENIVGISLAPPSAVGTFQVHKDSKFRPKLVMCQAPQTANTHTASE